jgi:hypothetical protein
VAAGLGGRTEGALLLGGDPIPSKFVGGGGAVA